MGIVAPQCGGCGAHVSSDFARVFYREDEEVDECIFCPDVPKTKFDRSNTL